MGSSTGSFTGLWLPDSAIAAAGVIASTTAAIAPPSEMAFRCLINPPVIVECRCLTLSMALTRNQAVRSLDSEAET